jgi:hypothetical protein
MKHDELHTLANRIEHTKGLDLDLAFAVLQGLQAASPAAAAELRPGVVESTDQALQLTARTLPNWSVVLEGTAREPDGRWTCTLRPSGTSDDEEVIGIGRGPTAPLALLVALLHVVAQPRDGDK